MDTQHLSLDQLRRRFPDEARARGELERLIWPSGPHCPACGGMQVWRFRAEGRRSRPGLFQCADRECRQQFTITTRTPLHSTKLPLTIWIQGLYLVLMTSKGMSSTALARMLGISQPTAWKLGHSIRALMSKCQGLAERLSGIVEVDTKRLGGAPRKRKNVKHPGGKGSSKPIVLIATARQGMVRAEVVPDEKARTMGPALERMIAPDAHLMSDADAALMKIGKDFAAHETVSHAQQEFVAGEAYSATADRFGGMLERIKLGVFHHMSRAHLQRYLDEACWRWNNRQQAQRRSRGAFRTVWEPLPFLVQLGSLLRVAVGCELRRTACGGIKVPQRKKDDGGKRRRVRIPDAISSEAPLAAAGLGSASSFCREAGCAVNDTLRVRHE
jgi:transposase-like protein